MKATIFALCLSPILSVGSIAIINNYHKWFPTMYYVRECSGKSEFLYRSGASYYLGTSDHKVPVWLDADLDKVCPVSFKAPAPQTCYYNGNGVIICQ